jgi:hypothetical protein
MPAEPKGLNLPTGALLTSADSPPRVEVREASGVRVVMVVGVVDERLNLAPAFQGVTGPVLVDLDGVEQVTSAGVRQWQTGVRACQASYLGLARCQPAMMTQFNSIRGFAGPGEVLSFYLGYLCGACDHAFEVLLDVLESRTVIQAKAPPDEKCPRCGGSAEFDDLPDLYFRYVSGAPVPNPPAPVRSLASRSLE